MDTMSPQDIESKRLLELSTDTRKNFNDLKTRAIHAQERIDTFQTLKAEFNKNILSPLAHDNEQMFFFVENNLHIDYRQITMDRIDQHAQNLGTLDHQLSNEISYLDTNLRERPNTLSQREAEYDTDTTNYLQNGYTLFAPTTPSDHAPSQPPVEKPKEHYQTKFSEADLDQSAKQELEEKAKRAEAAEQRRHDEQMQAQEQRQRALIQEQQRQKLLEDQQT